MPASVGPGRLLLAALLATDYAFADTRHLQPLQTVQPFDRRSLRKFGDRDAVQHSATLEKRFGNTAAASADIAALMEHGWHGAPPGKSISEASAKPTSETKTKEKEGPKGKNTQKSEEPVTAEVIMQMAKTRWHKDSSRQETISRLYHDLPGKGKMGSGTGGAARPNFEFMVERHYNFGKEPQNAWRFLERGAKAKANFGPVHYKSWEAAFTLLKSNFPQALSMANINKCKLEAMKKHEGVFGKNFKAGSYR